MFPRRWTGALTRLATATNLATLLLRRQLLRPVWLPPGLYRAVPWIYLGNGTACLAGALVLPDQAWLLPYGVLAGTGCLHLGVRVVLARRRGVAAGAPRAAAGSRLVPESSPAPANRGETR